MRHVDHVAATWSEKEIWKEEVLKGKTAITSIGFDLVGVMCCKEIFSFFLRSIMASRAWLQPSLLYCKYFIHDIGLGYTIVCVKHSILIWFFLNVIEYFICWEWSNMARVKDFVIWISVMRKDIWTVSAERL